MNTATRSSRKITESLRERTRDNITESKKPQQRFRITKKESSKNKLRRIRQQLESLASEDFRREVWKEYSKVKYYVITPQLHSLKLTHLEEQLLAICSSFSRVGEFTFLTNAQLAKLCNRNPDTISAGLKALEKYGLIRREANDDSRKIIVPRDIIKKLGLDDIKNAGQQRKKND